MNVNLTWFQADGDSNLPRISQTFVQFEFHIGMSTKHLHAFSLCLLTTNYIGLDSQSRHMYVNRDILWWLKNAESFKHSISFCLVFYGLFIDPNELCGFEWRISNHTLAICINYHWVNEGKSPIWQDGTGQDESLTSFTLIFPSSSLPFSGQPSYVIWCTCHYLPLSFSCLILSRSSLIFLSARPYTPYTCSILSVIPLAISLHHQIIL